MATADVSIPALAKLRSEAEAYEYLEGLRWGDKPVCAHCGAERVYFLQPKTGNYRRTRTGSVSERRVWKCGACRKQFSVLTGTIFHGTKISVRTWLFVVYEMCASKNGVAAREIERKYDLTPKTAWFMLHRIREAMRRDPLAGLLSGTVVADETFIGGTPKNRHRQGRPLRLANGGRGVSGSATDKTPVTVAGVEGDGRGPQPDHSQHHGRYLGRALAEQVNPATTTLHTDSAPAYRNIAADYAAHEFVDHSRYEYVRGDVTTNHAEGYFSQLKRSIDGTHHAVSVEHLDRYLAEFDYRYTTRKDTDSRRVSRLMGQVGGRRLTYRTRLGLGV